MFDGDIFKQDEFVLINKGVLKTLDGNTLDVKQDFYIQKTPITQFQWTVIMGNNPSHFSFNPLHPVENVSFNDVYIFIEKLNNITGLKYRLPTEVEWEYAARADSVGNYTFPIINIDKYVWYYYNSNNTTHQVGLKLPNKFGLHDMLGNVWEWTSSIYGKNNYVVLGGSYSNFAQFLRSAYRNNYWADYRGGNVGFRLVKDHP